MKVGFIGSGSIARALALGWSRAESPPQMFFTDSGSGRAESLAAGVSGSCLSSNAEIVAHCDVVILAFKPQVLSLVADELAPPLQVAPRPVVSLLAATPVKAVEELLPSGLEVFTFMPNTPVEIGAGLTTFVKGKKATEESTAKLVSLFEQLGSVVEIDQDQIEAATAIASSGPGFFAFLAEQLLRAGVTEGLSEELAAGLIGPTLAGTGALIQAREGDIRGVRQQVSSPGGGTELGISEMERLGVADGVTEGVIAAVKRYRGQA